MSRILWVLATFAACAVSLAFFAWVERNMALPYLPIELGWPWVSLTDAGIAQRVAWNAGLFLAFGVLHSTLAQHRAQQAVSRMTGSRAVRSAYVVVTGISLLLVMGLWQHTGVVLWNAPLPWTASQAISLAVFWGAMLACGVFVKTMDPLHFIGLKQLYGGADQSRTESSPKLIDTGMYARVRHPIYLFTLVAFVATPFMTLDRAILVVATAIYLAVAIPVEERKLIEVFGGAYLDYRKRVPAVLPLRFLRLG